jgi:predicted double-glycine peptidase
MKLLKFSAVSFVMLLLSVSVSAAPTTPRLPSRALPVPLVSQATNYSCGAAALLSILYYWKVYDGNETDLYKSLKTNKKNGTQPEKIVEVARQFGLEAHYVENMKLEELRDHLSKGHTVVVNLQAWRDESGKEAALPWSEVWDSGHYVVLVAMDRKNAYFMDPSGHAGYTWVPISEMMDRWHDSDRLRGRLVKYYQLAVVIRGQSSLPSAPAPLIRMQ